MDIVNGVLEWFADRLGMNNCRKVQLEFLEEIVRCLRGNGKIAIAIENRWHIGFLIGETPHGEARFVIVLPRIMARVVN